MTLEVYLMEKLNLKEQEAVKICETLRSYKKEYGHRSLKNSFRGEKNREALRAKPASGASRDHSQLCCDGCEKRCPLDDLGCGKGRRMYPS